MKGHVLKRGDLHVHVRRKRVEEGRHVAPSRRTVGAFLTDDWLPAIKDSAAATTWGNWKVYAASYVIPTIGAVRLQLADKTGASIHTARAALRRFRAGRYPAAKSAGLEPKTVRNVHVMMHAALASAVNWRYVVENVASNVRPPRIRRRKPTVWTPEQLRAFLRSVREDRFYALYLLAATTGLRRGELCGLRWPAVDLKRGSVSVEPDTRVVVNGRAMDSDGKTDNAPRMLALDPVTVTAHWRPGRAARPANGPSSAGTTRTAIASSRGRTDGRCTPMSSGSGSTASRPAAGSPTSAFTT